MKQHIKNLLKKVPPFKQFLARMKYLEERVSFQLIKVQRENFSLKRMIETGNRQISSLESQILILEKEIKRLDGRVDNANKQSHYLYLKGLHPDSYKVALIDWYYQRTWKYLDLENPQTFNEKMQWLKLYDATPLKTLLADKFRAREWIKEKIGDEYLIPLLGAWDCFDQIDFDELPDQFVLKTNHSSGWNQVVKDKAALDIKRTKGKFDDWMKKNFAFQFGLEFHYMNIPHKIIAEKYMAGLDGDILDYRFFCFNGQPKYVWVDIGSGTNHHRRNIYDLEWNLQDYGVNYPPISPEPEKPAKFDEMIVLATTLCAEFAFVRVDFYYIEDRIYFGELTFTPQSGTGKWDSEEQNLHYGSLINLPEKKPMQERLF